MVTPYKWKDNHNWTILRKIINEWLPPKDYLSLCKREEIISISTLKRSKTYVYLKQSEAILAYRLIPAILLCQYLDTKYPNTISLGLWFLQYSNIWKIWVDNCTIAMICHEPIEYDEFKYSSSKCSDEIKQKTHITVSMQCDIYIISYNQWYVWSHFLESPTATESNVSSIN